MRALGILQEEVGESLDFMHSKQRDALWRVVHGLLKGQALWLTELGRNLPAGCALKHRIKAADRVVGSSALWMAIPKIYTVLANVLLRTTKRPVLLVDWTAAESGFHVLSAKVAFAGRALTILSRTYPEQLKANPDAEREFLSELKTIVPPDCRPVVVTDAGFLFKWTESVRALGWDYVGRVRFKRMLVKVRGRWMRLRNVYKLSNAKARALGEVVISQNNPRSHRAVLSATPKTRGRQRLGRKGKPLRGGVPSSCRDAAREPLLLITSLSDAPAVIVKIYRLRMQIEQTFRDLKSHRYGWSTRHIRTAHRERVDVMLVIAALAALAMHLIGLAARGQPIARGLQANTERRRNVFSTFFLAKLVLLYGLEPELPLRAIRAALTTLLDALPTVERMTV